LFSRKTFNSEKSRVIQNLNKNIYNAKIGRGHRKEEIKLIRNNVDKKIRNIDNPSNKKSERFLTDDTTVYQYFLSSTISSSILNSIPTYIPGMISVGHDSTESLTSFKTEWQVDDSLDFILVKIVTRGASQILVAFNKGATSAAVYANSANEILNVDTTYLDYPAAEGVENYHLIPTRGDYG